MIRQEADIEKEKNDIQEFFKKHNITKENRASWTVVLENEKVEEWAHVLRKEFQESYRKAIQNTHRRKRNISNSL